MLLKLKKVLHEVYQDQKKINSTHDEEYLIKIKVQNLYSSKLKVQNYQLWQVMKGDKIVLCTKDKYSIEDIIQLELDAKVKNCIYYTLAASEFYKIS
ncbi:hypothetical protein ACLOJK_024312 [Asimina triloba]